MPSYKRVSNDPAILFCIKNKKSLMQSLLQALEYSTKGRVVLRKRTLSTVDKRWWIYSESNDSTTVKLDYNIEIENNGKGIFKDVSLPNIEGVELGITGGGLVHFEHDDDKITGASLEILRGDDFIFRKDKGHIVSDSKGKLERMGLSRWKKPIGYEFELNPKNLKLK